MRAKLVFESLNELRSFNQKKDPLSSLGVGQRKLIEDWLDEMGVKNYTINDDLTINVEGHVDLSNRDLIRFPNYIKFNHISGDFSCADNQLISLKGCPTSINPGFFNCKCNQLISLESWPSSVRGGYFFCRNNKIKFTKEYIKSLCKVLTTAIEC
jgi:hypothetical protein